MKYLYDSKSKSMETLEEVGLTASNYELLQGIGALCTPPLEADVVANLLINWYRLGDFDPQELLELSIYDDRPDL